MKPTFSIIFFTVSSGAGLGLLALLALVDMCPAPLLSDALTFWGIALALLLIVGGLASSAPSSRQAVQCVARVLALPHLVAVARGGRFRAAGSGHARYAAVVWSGTTGGCARCCRSS